MVEVSEKQVSAALLNHDSFYSSESFTYCNMLEDMNRFKSKKIGFQTGTETMDLDNAYSDCGSDSEDA